MKLTVGTYLKNGKYRIEKILGQGTFGITYLASAKFSMDGGMEDVTVSVAIKEFFMCDVNGRKPDGRSVEGSNSSVFSYYRTKFKKEAYNLSMLDHSGIVRVYDVFDENGTTYYSMEYVDGVNLDDYISRNNPIEESDAIDIIGRICEALAFMHSKQMLHLDLKPKNIMRSLNGRIYLIDFGLSKQFTSNGEPESSTTIGKGTPGYAPLEQAKLIKDGTFPATLDIYALGATMYKILTGTRPLDASDILNEGFSDTLLIKYNRSKSLIKIIERCMSPMKKDRYQRISDIISLLSEIEPIKPSSNSIVDDSAEQTEVQKPKKHKKNQPSRNSTSAIEVKESDNASIFTNKKPFQKRSATDEDEVIQKSRFRKFLSRISGNSTIWHDLKLTIGIVAISVVIMFALINIATGKTDDSTNTKTGQTDYLQYYQPNSAIVDSILNNAVREGLKSKDRIN